MDHYNIYQDYDQILFKNEVARGTRQLNIMGYSPSGDLEYAADIACGAICEMLRLCREKKASLWWYHLPVIRRRHLAYA